MSLKRNANSDLRTTCTSVGLINVRHRRRLISRSTKILIWLRLYPQSSRCFFSWRECCWNSHAAALIFLRHQPQSKNIFTYSVKVLKNACEKKFNCERNLISEIRRKKLCVHKNIFCLLLFPFEEIKRKLIRKAHAKKELLTEQAHILCKKSNIHKTLNYYPTYGCKHALLFIPEQPRTKICIIIGSTNSSFASQRSNKMGMKTSAHRFLEELDFIWKIATFLSSSMQQNKRQHVAPLRSPIRMHLPHTHFSLSAHFAYVPFVCCSIQLDWNIILRRSLIVLSRWFIANNNWRFSLF